VLFRSKVKPITFEDAKRGLLALLADVGEEFWHGKVADASAGSFRGILGGMGTFNDLVICPQNKHRIADEKEPFANELLSCLTSVCYVASRCDSLDPFDAVTACGTVGLVLTGWRCLACGHSQVSYYDIRAFIATVAVREALKRGIDPVLQLWHRKEDVEALGEMINVATKSGIIVTHDKAWMRPCPSCKGNDTCVYRWNLENGLFVADADNLPMEGKS
jgi:hypothetical protein